MAIVIQPYRPEHEPAVAEFNQRLRLAGADENMTFYRHAQPRWLPDHTCHCQRNYRFARQSYSGSRCRRRWRNRTGRLCAQKSGILFPRWADSLHRLLSSPAVGRHRQQGSCHRGHSAAARCHATCAAALLSRHGRLRQSAAADADSHGMDALPGTVFLSGHESLAFSSTHAGTARIASAAFSDGPRGLQRCGMAGLDVISTLPRSRGAEIAGGRIP